MGMTPLEGLVMGTRSGDIDPGLHKVLCDRLGMDIEGVTALLNEHSGLLGLSGLSNDMRSLLEAADEGHEGARTAIEVFCYRLAKQIAAMLVSLGKSPDAIVFTGGIGERAAAIRAHVAELLVPIGVRLDPLRNEAHGASSQGVISSAGSHPCAMVVPTNEERMIAEDYVNGYLFQLAFPTIAKAGVEGLWVNAPTQATDLTGVSWAE
jgi:acetate kinase